MKMTRRSLLALVTGAIASGALARPSFAADSVVNVSLWDKGDHSMDMLENGEIKGIGMGMTGGNITMATMGITASPQKVPAGVVTFEVVNKSKNIFHNMVVSPVPADGKPLPYSKDEEKVDEEAARHLGEVSELEPGQKGVLTLNLKPGKYILYCNVAGHYVLGMWTLLDVTG